MSSLASFSTISTTRLMSSFVTALNSFSSMPITRAKTNGWILLHQSRANGHFKLLRTCTWGKESLVNADDQLTAARRQSRIVESCAYHDEGFEEHDDVAQLGRPVEDGQARGDVVEATRHAERVQVVHHEHRDPAHALQAQYKEKVSEQLRLSQASDLLEAMSTAA